MTRIQRVNGYEVLDSRGNPTVEVSVELEDGSTGLVSVHAGRSTVKGRTSNPHPAPRERSLP